MTGIIEQRASAELKRRGYIEDAEIIGEVKKDMPPSVFTGDTGDKIEESSNDAGLSDLNLSPKAKNDVGTTGDKPRFEVFDEKKTTYTAFITVNGRREAANQIELGYAVR